MSSKQFRSEEARKNYEKAERQRTRAKQRKARAAQTEELIGKAKAWLKNNTRLALTAAAAVVMVMIAASALASVLSDPLKDKQDNWLIINTAAPGKAARYEHLADFTVPAGYTLDEYSTYDDEMTQDFFCIAQDQSAVVQDVYVSGSTALKAADFPTTILSYNLHKAAGEPRQLTIHGQPCHALYMVTDESEYYGEGLNLAHMSFYFDAGDACVTAILRSNMLPMDQLPDEAALLAEAEKLLSGLTLTK